MNPANLVWNNADLMSYTEIHDTQKTYNKIPVKPNKFTILMSEANVVIEAIGEYRHKLSQKEKEFTFHFIKSIKHMKSITPAQMKILRDVQKKIDPNYLKQPKDWI
jgi:hypothetical protein